METPDLFAPPTPEQMRQRTLGGFVRQQEAARQNPANFVDLANARATRSMPISDALNQNIMSALAAAYGPGYRAQVYSGGQPALGAGGARVGSTRHDGGNAADVYILDPQGNRLSGDALAPLAKHWLKNRYGGVGLEMKGGGIHLDTHTDRAPFWTYGPLTPGQQAAVKEALGNLPTTAVAARSPAAPGGVAAAPAMPGAPGPQQMPQMAAPQPMMAAGPPPVAQFALAQMFAQSEQEQRLLEEKKAADMARKRALFG